MQRLMPAFNNPYFKRAVEIRNFNRVLRRHLAAHSESPFREQLGDEHG